METPLGNGRGQASRRGLALVVVAGVLGLLSMLVVPFVTMIQLERKAADQRLRMTKAGLLARSGLEDALARLGAGQDPGTPPNRYRGEDWDGDGFWDPGPEEQGSEVFRPGALNVEDCPVRHALRPSFFVAVGLDPRTTRVNGKLRGCTGQLGTNTYALKIEDESAKINVNGGFLDELNRDAASGDLLPDHQDPDVRPDPADPRDTGLGWNSQLRRILDVLGDQPEVGIPGLGDLVIAHRPAGGYGSLAELQSALGTDKDLSPYLTTLSWTDAKVVRPNGFPGQPAPASGAMNDVKKARNPLRLEEGGRPPVNLNAAPKPVLLALIRDLQGTTWQDGSHPVTYQVDPATAAGIADALVAARDAQPFSTWSQFSAFCDGLVPGVIHGLNASPQGHAHWGGGNLCGADLLKANFDPNTSLAKQLPDQLTFRWIDKSDLLVWSTEGGLGPTGLFRITSVGRMTGPDSQVLAEVQRDMTVEAFRMLRQTTQRDFVAGRVPDDTPESYLSPAADGLQRTAGASAAWRNWGGGPDRGLGVVSYPSAMAGLPSQAAEFDGGLGLATAELPPGNPVGASLFFLHHFDDGWSADYGAIPPPAHGPYDASLQQDAGTGVWPSSGEPGTLLPDGAHLQPGRSLGFLVSDNFPPATPTATSGVFYNHAVVSYWVKANGKLGTGAGECVTDFSIQARRKTSLAGNEWQTFMIGREMGDGQWGAVLENSCSPVAPGGLGQDSGRERQFRVAHDVGGRLAMPDLRWSLVTAFADTAQAVPADGDVALSVWRAQGHGIPSSTTLYPAGFNLAVSENLIMPGLRFVLGRQDLLSNAAIGQMTADQILDEFAILDFRPGGPQAKLRCDAWHQDRWRDGRYYRGNDACFTSVPLEPAISGKARLLRVSWTAYLPGETRQELVPQALTMPAAGSPRYADPLLASSRVDVELRDEVTLDVHPLAQGQALDRSLSRFRYRVRFRNLLGDPLHDPVLETPYFDDITFAWAAPGGPQVLEWN